MARRQKGDAGTVRRPRREAVIGTACRDPLRCSTRNVHHAMSSSNRSVSGCPRPISGSGVSNSHVEHSSPAPFRDTLMAIMESLRSQRSGPPHHGQPPPVRRHLRGGISRRHELLHPGSVAVHAVQVGRRDRPVVEFIVAGACIVIGGKKRQALSVWRPRRRQTGRQPFHRLTNAVPDLDLIEAMQPAWNLELPNRVAARVVEHLSRSQSVRVTCRVNHEFTIGSHIHRCSPDDVLDCAVSTVLGVVAHAQPGPSARTVYGARPCWKSTAEPLGSHATPATGGVREAGAYDTSDARWPSVGGPVELIAPVPGAGGRPPHAARLSETTTAISVSAARGHLGGSSLSA